MHELDTMQDFAALFLPQRPHGPTCYSWWWTTSGLSWAAMEKATWSLPTLTSWPPRASASIGPTCRSVTVLMSPGHPHFIIIFVVVGFFVCFCLFVFCWFVCLFIIVVLVWFGKKKKKKSGYSHAWFSCCTKFSLFPHLYRPGLFTFIFSNPSH